MYKVAVLNPLLIWYVARVDIFISLIVSGGGGRLRGSDDWAHGEGTPRLDGFDAVDDEDAASLGFFHLRLDCHELGGSLQDFSGHDGVVVADASSGVGVSDFKFHVAFSCCLKPLKRNLS